MALGYDYESDDEEPTQRMVRRARVAPSAPPASPDADTVTEWTEGSSLRRSPARDGGRARRWSLTWLRYVFATPLAAKTF